MKRMTKEELVGLETKGATVKAQAKPRPPKPVPAPKIDVKVEAKPDPDIKALLTAVKDLVERHGVTIAQLAAIISHIDSRPVGLEGVSELRITARDQDDNIAAVEPVMKTRH